ncbi:iron complex outermembrane receptor protein [Sphingomonas sp. UYAg733]
MRGYRGSLSPAVLIATIMFAPAAYAASNTGQDVVADTDIVVTAQKRTEAILDIPQSVSVIGGETLERRQASSFEDYIALVPGLSLESGTAGVSRLTLRGINTGGAASTVAVYVDEIPFGSSSGLANGAILAGDFDTFDVKRIEVLRGPQGTLYGASSLGGVLKFVTEAPNTSKFEAEARAGIETVSGGDIGYSGAALINIPISDRVAVRASGFYRFDDGFIDSIGNNPVTSATDPNINIIPSSRIAKNINAVRSYGGRFSALAEMSDTLSIRFNALLQNLESDASNHFEVDPRTLKPLYGGLVLSQYHPEFTDSKYRVYGMTAEWDLGFASLTNSTSFSTFKADQQRDYALFLGPIATELFGDPATRPLSAILRQSTSTKKFTEEVRLSSPDSDVLEWLIGGYYTHERSAIDPQNFFAVAPGSETIATGVPTLIEVYLRSVFKEYALFGNATFHVTSKFDVTAGGRYSRNEQNASQLRDQTALGGIRENIGQAPSSENVFTFSFAPRYELSKNTSAYARVSTGYRPGGPNVLPPEAPAGTPRTYKSDRVTSYEAGLKGSWMGGQLALDVSAFYLDWTDIQLVTLINQTGVNANGGSAISKGVEFNVTLRPTRGLNVGINGAYTDARLTADTDPIVGGLDGDALPFVPKWTFSISGDYDWSIGKDATAFLGASLGFVDDRIADFSIRDDAGRLREAPSYETIDLRAGVNFGGFSLEAFVRNAANKRGVTSMFGFYPGAFPNDAAAVAVIRPRTIGLTIGSKF